VLLGQVLNLEFLLVNGALILKAGLLLPNGLEEVAHHGVCPIFLLHAVEDAQEGLVLSVQANPNLVNNTFLAMALLTRLSSAASHEQSPC